MVTCRPVITSHSHSHLQTRYFINAEPWYLLLQILGTLPVSGRPGQRLATRALRDHPAIIAVAMHAPVALGKRMGRHSANPLSGSAA